MKIFRSFKYVLTAAAVCILCFSGNGEYIYTVWAMIPENDIVEQPDNTDTLRKTDNERSEKISRRKNLYIIHCLADKYIADTQKQKYDDYKSLDTSYCYIADTSVDEALYKLFTANLHGNRSP